MQECKIYLKPGREKSVIAGHPWIFNGAIGKIVGEPISGEIYQVFTFKGDLLGSGFYNNVSSITVRMVTHNTDKFTANTLLDRIKNAFQRRTSILNKETNSCRLVNAEGDFLPGLIIDKFDTCISIQILSAGMEIFRENIIEMIQHEFSSKGIIDRSDPESREREGLESSEKIISGQIPSDLIIRENGFSFFADIAAGQKTGFYFDQRFNRYLLSSYAQDKKVLDCFAYSGAFSVYALHAGALHSTLVDISEDAINIAKSNIELNEFIGKCSFVKENCFSYLRGISSDFDLIILDPPKFAKHSGEVQKASRGYKDINLQAIKKIKSGGIIFTFSCSGAIDPYLFSQIVYSAAQDARRDVQILHRLTAGPDHPVNIAHREGDYLKGLVLRVF